MVGNLSRYKQPEWINGEVNVNDLGTGSTLGAGTDEGIYLLFYDDIVLTDRGLLFTNVILDDMGNVSCIIQRRFYSTSAIEQRIYDANNWSDWKEYAYKADIIQRGTKTATSEGIPNQMAYDDDYFYLCIAMGTWIQFAKTPWEG